MRPAACPPPPPHLPCLLAHPSLTCPAFFLPQPPFTCPAPCPPAPPPPPHTHTYKHLPTPAPHPPRRPPLPPAPCTCPHQLRVPRYSRPHPGQAHGIRPILRQRCRGHTLTLHDGVRMCIGRQAWLHEARLHEGPMHRQYAATSYGCPNQCTGSTLQPVMTVPINAQAE